MITTLQVLAGVVIGTLTYVGVILLLARLISISEEDVDGPTKPR